MACGGARWGGCNWGDRLGTRVMEGSLGGKGAGRNKRSIIREFVFIVVYISACGWGGDREWDIATEVTTS